MKLKVVETPKNGKVVALAANNCFLWGKDSTVLCNNGTIGIEHNFNGRDSMRLLETRNSITSLELSPGGEWALAGTRDSGWYFIPTQEPEKYMQVPQREMHCEIMGFFFDTLRQHIWVKEGKRSVANVFTGLSLYDYSKGSPSFVKGIKAEEMGIYRDADPKFGFDFKNNLLFIQYGLSFMMTFDLVSQKVTHDFFNELHGNSILSIQALFFNPEDSKLYFAAQKSKGANTESEYSLFSLRPDTSAPIFIVSPENLPDKDQFYRPGLQTVLNKLPQQIYGNHEKISIAANNLAVLPYNENEYLLFNILNGNMVTSFAPANLNLNPKSRFIQTNKVQISPKGNYIFEWMILAGITMGLPDTLQVALTNLQSGIIIRKTIILAAAKSESVEHVYWNRFDLPAFVKKSDGDYPVKLFETFSFDSLLNATKTNGYRDSSKESVVYKVWQLPESNQYLVEQGNLRNKKGSQYLIASSADSSEKLLQGYYENAKIMINREGFLLAETIENQMQLKWFDLDGNLIHISKFSSDLVVQNLHGSNLYARERGSGRILCVNLLNGKAIDIKYTSKPGFDFIVGPKENLMVSLDEELQAWQIHHDALHKLYGQRPLQNFINTTQITQNLLMSDGRIWNLENGRLTHAEISIQGLVNDSIYIKNVSPWEILEDGGWGTPDKERYKVLAGINIFIPSMAKAPNLAEWAKNLDKTLIATVNLKTNLLQDIYELPITSGYNTKIEYNPIDGGKSLFIVKKENSLFVPANTKPEPDELLLLNLQTGAFSNRLSGKVVSKKQMPGAGPLLFYMVNNKSNRVEAYKVTGGAFNRIEQNVRWSADSLYELNIVDENRVVYQTQNGIVFRNTQTNETNEIKYRFISGRGEVLIQLFYHNEEDALYAGYSQGSILKIKDNMVVKCMNSMPAFKGFEASRDKHLLATDPAGNYYFINRETLEADLSLTTFEGNSFTDRKYIWLTKEKNYLATPGVERNIHFAEKNLDIPLKQGDITFNRPDKVLEYLGGPREEIDFFRQLHELRIKKFTQKQKYTVNAGEQAMVNSGIHTGRAFELTIAMPENAESSQLQVVVNGCPVGLGTNLIQQKDSIIRKMNIPLNAGNNTIYVWKEDGSGNRNSFTEYKAIGEFADSGKWYFAGIGVSNYRDASQNLKYADKDIRDIAGFLSREYPGIVIDTLFNEDVTPSNISRLKERLMNTKPDDKVMVSFSGHGLLDKDKKFWYATHNIDFSQPEQKGFSMNAITGLLENIPARYRLITLDACHSGDEVSGFSGPVKTTVLPQPARDTGKIKGVKLPGTSLEQTKSNSELLKSMQMVFTDQVSNTGINLMAASSSAEFALEGEKWQNGVFTYTLINGWGFAARKNKSNQKVHYRDLKQYLQETVSAITQGRQTPNTVMENAEIDWWLISDN